MTSEDESRYRRSSTPLDERFARNAEDLAVVYEEDPAAAMEIRSLQIIATSSRRPPGYPAWPRLILPDSVPPKEAVASEEPNAAKAASPNTTTDERTLVAATPLVKITKSSPKQFSSPCIARSPIALMPHLGYHKRKVSPTIPPLKSSSAPSLKETLQITARGKHPGTLQKEMCKESADNLNGNGTSASFLKQNASKPGRKPKFVESFRNTNGDNTTSDMSNLKISKTREVEVDRKVSDPSPAKKEIIQEKRNIFNPFAARADVTHEESDKDEGVTLLGEHPGGTFKVLSSSYTNTRPSTASTAASDITMRPISASTQQTDITRSTLAGPASYNKAEAFTATPMRPKTDTTTFDGICGSNGLAIAESQDVDEHVPKLSGTKKVKAGVRRLSHILRMGRKSVSAKDAEDEALAVPAKGYAPVKQDENEK